MKGKSAGIGNIDYSGFIADLIGAIKSRAMSKQDISKLKARLCKKHGIKKMPTDIEIMEYADIAQLDFLRKYLLTKPTRTLSGVSVVAVMSYPFPCPHGKCLMCPSKTSEGIPQSYTGKEPATMRAMRNNFDPYLQVFNRLEQYVVLGHSVSKIELIIMGGTFPSFPVSYQEEFVMYLFKAMNDFSRMFFGKSGTINMSRFREFFELPGDINDKGRLKRIHKKLKLMKSKSQLEKEQQKNEKSFVRCVGLTIETRPDYGMLKHGNEMLKLGCTRVELGVQSVYDDILDNINRGHSVADSVNSTQILKDLGFKINYHIMPGLPGATRKRDIEGFKRLFSDPDFRPDMLKIYPCMVVRESDLYDIWKKGLYKPLNTEQAARLIYEFKKYVPEYVRIMRVQRDIPTYAIEAGVGITNLRQYIHEKLKPECRCIRCREIARRKFSGSYYIKITEYDASHGREFFIAAEDKQHDSLYGFCRLRLPSQQLRKEITKGTAIIRELHVFGKSISIGAKGKKKNSVQQNAVQHRGIGKQLLKKAEEIAKKNNKNKVIVISGTGAREYYRKLGYRKQGPYMAKRI